MFKKTVRWFAFLTALTVVLGGCAPTTPLTLQDVPGQPATAAFSTELRAALARLPQGRYSWNGFVTTESGNYNSHTSQNSETMITFSVNADHGRYRGRLFTPLFSRHFYYAAGHLYLQDKEGWHLSQGGVLAPDPLGALRGLTGLTAVVRRLPASHVGPMLCRVYALDTTAGKLLAPLGPGAVLSSVEAAVPVRVILWIGYGNRGRYSQGNGLLYRVETYTTVPAAGKPGIWQASSFTLNYQGKAVRVPRDLPEWNLLSPKP